MSPSGHTCDVIIVAAGRGQRYGSENPKQYNPLAGRPILRWSLETFVAHPRVRRIVTVIHPDDRASFDAAAMGLRVQSPVLGGATRQESVLRGLECLAADPPDYVLIHDAARPGIDAHVISRVIDALAHAPGVIPVLAVADTLKRIDANARITETVPRAQLAAAQTPQGFHYDKIVAAHRAVRGLELTDDAAVLERAGLGVQTVPGGVANTKITTQDDLNRMEQTLLETRVGTGFGAKNDKITLTYGVGLEYRWITLGYDVITKVDQENLLAPTEPKIKQDFKRLSAGLKFAFYIGARTVAVAWAAIPSPRPVKPKPSVVVAFTLIRFGSTPAMLARWATMASRCGPTLGRSQIMVMSKCVSVPPRARNNAMAWVRKFSDGESL